MKKIYFAGGCFWGVQHFFDSAYEDSFDSTDAVWLGKIAALVVISG